MALINIILIVWGCMIIALVPVWIYSKIAYGKCSGLFDGLEEWRSEKREWLNHPKVGNTRHWKSN